MLCFSSRLQLLLDPREGCHWHHIRSHPRFPLLVVFLAAEIKHKSNSFSCRTRAEQQRLQQNAAALEACTFRPVVNLCASGRCSRPRGPAGTPPCSTAGARRPATPEVLRRHRRPCLGRRRIADAVWRAVVHMPAVWDSFLFWRALPTGDAQWHEGGSLYDLQGPQSPVTTATHTRNPRHLLPRKLQPPQVCAGSLTVSPFPQGRPSSAPSGAEAALDYRTSCLRRQLDSAPVASQAQQAPLLPAPPHMDSAEPSLDAPLSAACLPAPTYGSDIAPAAAEVEVAAPVSGCDDAPEVKATSPVNGPDDALAAAGVEAAPPVLGSDDAPAVAEVKAARAKCHEATAEAPRPPAARTAAAGGPVFGRLYQQALVSQRCRAQSAQAAVEAEMAELAAARLHATPVMPAAAAALAAAAARRQRPPSSGLPPPTFKRLPLLCLPAQLSLTPPESCLS